MASVFYNEFKKDLLDTWQGSADVRVALLMANTTADTENDGIVNLADITTLDECDATGYSRVTLTSEAVTKDDTGDRGEYYAADAVFSGLSGDATRNIVGALVYEHVDGTAANDKVVAYVEFSSAVTSSATQVTVSWNTEGILQVG